jgi:SSS family solute:Na+ symporter
MAACLYAVATAIGLVALAFSAPRIQKTGQSIWTYFGSLYGPAISQQVAAFSLILLTGVLGAQIRGASAILALSGMSQATSIILVDCLVLVFSFLWLSWLSGIFALCMCGCTTILVYALVETHSLSLWLRAPAIFMESIRAQPAGHVGLVLLSVVASVLCGADYQQFPAMARTPTHARSRCLIVAVIVLGVGFLPASAVIASANPWQLGHLADQAPVVPTLLARSIGSSSQVMSLAVTCILITTALGSASSVLRAMNDATATASRGSSIPPVLYQTPLVFAATLVAIRGQSIVNVMVTLNIAYLAAVVPLLALTLLGCPIQSEPAKRSMFVSAGVSALCVLIEWTHPSTYRKQHHSYWHGPAR